MAFTATTSNSAPAWRPDLYEFSPIDVVPDALILQLTTVGGTVDGDQPSVHVGFVDDATAVFKAEGDTLDESQPGLNEAVAYTAKLTQLIRLSREQYFQVSTPDQLSLSVQRAIIRRADIAFLSEPAPQAPANAPMPGLLNTVGIIDGGSVSTNLDKISDLIARLEDNLAIPSAIVVDPLGWSEIRKLKIGTAYNQTLLGAGTEDTATRLFSLPVFVNVGMPDYTGVVVDRNSVVSAIGSVVISTSEHKYFDSDGIALRATWRFGHVVARPNRLGKFTIVPAGS
jgi:HK97 family phage major capsid protein